MSHKKNIHDFSINLQHLFRSLSCISCSVKYCPVLKSRSNWLLDGTWQSAMSIKHKTFEKDIFLIVVLELDLRKM